MISREMGISPKIIHLIVSKFFTGLRSLLKKNEEINIKGFFIIKLQSSYKKKILKKGKNINLRKRKDQKNYYVKKSKK